MASRTDALFLLALLFLSAAQASWGQEPLRRVRSVRFEGTKRVPDEVLESTIRQRPGVPFDAQALDEDVKTLYARFGLRAVVEKRETEEGVDLVFRLAAEPLVRSISVEGIDEGRAAELLAEVGLEGAVGLLPAVVEERVRRLETVLREEGRYDARAEVRFEERGEGEARAVIVVHEGPKVEVKEVRIEGIEGELAEDILDTLETQPTRFFVFRNYLRRKALERDRLEIERLLRAEGYLDAVARAPRVERLEEDAARVVFPVECGKRYVVSEVRVEGADGIEGFEPRALLRLEPGMPLRRAALERDRRALAEALGRLGYASARVETRLLFDEREPAAAVVFLVRPGARMRIRDVLVRGNERTRDEVIRREVSLAPGDWVDTKEVRRTLERLRRLGTFVDERGRDLVDVRLLPVEGRPDQADLLVQVEEGRSGELFFTLGGMTDIGLFAGVQLTKRNFDWRAAPSAWDPITLLREFWNNEAFHGGGQELSIQALPGTRVSNYSVRFRDPHHAGRPDEPVALELEAYGRTVQIFREFREDRFGFSLLRERGREEGPRVGLFGRVEAVSIGDLDDAPSEVEDEKGVHFVPAVGVTWKEDRFDSLLDPREGDGSEARAELLLGEAFGARAAFAARRLRPLPFAPEDERGRRRTLALRGAVGVAGGPGGALPFYERLHAGGSTGFFPLRGFEVRGIGPASGGVHLGGAFAWTASAEAWIPLASARDPVTDEEVDRLVGVVFADAGGVGDTPLFAPRLSIGLGVRVRVPFLGPTPVAVDLAVPLLRSAGDDTEFLSLRVTTRF